MAVGVAFGDLAGDLRRDRAQTGNLAGALVQARQGGEVDAELDGLVPARFPATVAREQVGGHVGPELIHGPAVAGRLERQGVGVDPVPDGAGPVEGDVEEMDLACPLLVARTQKVRCSTVRS